MSDREEFEAHIKGTAWYQVLSGAAKDDDEGASVFRMARMAASEAWTAAERQSAAEIETLRAVLQDILAAGPVKEDEYPLLMARAKAALGGGV